MGCGGSRSGLPPSTSRLKLQDARFPPEHLDGPSVSTLVFALRRELPLTPTRSSQPELRGVEPPPEREADLSTLMVPRSYPSVDARWHGIVQHRQRKPTSVRRKPTSEFETVSLSWLLYAPVYVDLPQLPTFLDPPWLLLSSHPARFDQPVVPSRTIVGLHHLHGKTSAFKNCPFGGSLPSILPSIGSEHVHLGSVVLLVTTSNPLLNHGGSLLRGRRQEAVWHHWAHGNVMGGSNVLGANSWRSSLMEKILCGEKVILIWIKRCFVHLLVWCS